MRFAGSTYSTERNLNQDRSNLPYGILYHSYSDINFDRILYQVDNRQIFGDK